MRRRNDDHQQSYGLTAAIEALRALKRHCRMRLFTDSSYVKQGIRPGFTAGSRLPADKAGKNAASGECWTSWRLRTWNGAG